MENDDCKEKGDKRGVRLTERKNVRKTGGGPGRVEESKKEEKKSKNEVSKEERRKMAKNDEQMERHRK